jgi:integrase
MWKVRMMRFENGERICLPLIDNVPVFYPTYYVTRRLRSNTPSTQRNQLNELRVLSYWEVDSGILLVDRLKNDEPLTDIEIQSLVDFSGYSLETIRKIQSGVKLLRTGYSYVDNEVKRFRLKTISAYIQFLYTLVSAAKDRDVQAQSLKAKIKGYIPKRRRHLNKTEEKVLTDEQVDVLLEKLKPGHPESPFTGEAVQCRNLAMMHVLYETGIRKGELLGLYVEDIDFGEGLVKIRRRHHDPRDPRTYQPLQKTKERDIPIPSGLVEVLAFYVMEIRGRSKAARKHPVLFVAHHGGDEGNALSSAGCQYIFTQFLKAFPVMKGAHTHLLRHHMNYRLSGMLENIEGWQDMTPEERMRLDESVRTDLMGWKPGSSMQELYNKRYHKEVANKVMAKRADALKGVVPSIANKGDE